MKQKNNAIQEEKDYQAIFRPKEEPNDQEDLKTDEWIEAVSDFEMFSEQLQRVIYDLHQWKWAVIALHSGIQGMMILALNVGDGLSVLQKKDAEQYLCWKKGDRSEPVPRGKLVPFLDLYKNIKDDKSPMNRSPDTQHFVPKGTQDKSIKLLHHLRNEFMHFTPKRWILNREGLPAMASDCLEIAEFLAWESGNIIWYEHDLKKRLKIAFTSARKSLSAVEKEYNGGTS
ncbi:MAG: hypothetical protein OXN20_08960 [Gemmatimonadota bacterium]|nr:hypothetical protein [Gemmatimonadota bacterium]